MPTLPLPDMPSPSVALAPAAAAGATTATTGTTQQQFHQRWDHLHDPHVRALAWLLDAPDLLDPLAPAWNRRIAILDIAPACAAWLTAVDAQPQALHDFLNLPTCTRLGRYAEKLMAFYFAWCGTLVAHGLQVQAAGRDTVGEFDFLLGEGAALVHLELATKFYLFESFSGAESCEASESFISSESSVEYFVGPNLADTLAAKMQKILIRQLALGQHPAAQAYLPQPVTRAQALIKGWLFYRQACAAADIDAAAAANGVAADHCRGFWCCLSEFATHPGQRYLILPRLAWLAPARVAASATSAGAALLALLEGHFVSDSMPVLVAIMDVAGGVAREVARGFIVPDDWRARAHERNQRTVLRLPVASAAS